MKPKTDGGSPNYLLDPMLTLGSDIEQLTVSFLSSFGLTQNEDVKLLMCTISMRCLNFFRAVLCLSRKQLAQPAAACVRSLMEQRWVLESVACESSREEAIRRLTEHDEYNRKRCLDDLRRLSQEERDHRITKDSLDRIEADLNSPRSKHTLISWAKLANRESEYRTAYALLSAQAHPSLRAAGSHLSFDADGQVHSVTAKAESELLPLYLMHACEIMIDVIAVCPVSWRTDEVASHATKLRHGLGELWGNIPDPLTHSWTV